MNKPLVQELESIMNDITHNYNKFNQTKLIEAIAKFQKNILSLRKQDVEIKSKLENFTSKQILDLSNKLDLNLLYPPKQKNILVHLINSLILQKGKKDEFLKIAKSIEISRRVIPARKPKKMTVSSTSEYNSLRKLWLTSENLNQLEIELKDINMNIIRAVVKPWGVKPSGRTKIALITAVINYIKRMRRFSKLGT